MISPIKSSQKTHKFNPGNIIYRASDGWQELILSCLPGNYYLVKILHTPNKRGSALEEMMVDCKLTDLQFDLLVNYNKIWAALNDC